LILTTGAWKCNWQSKNE